MNWTEFRFGSKSTPSKSGAYSPLSFLKNSLANKLLKFCTIEFLLWDCAEDFENYNVSGTLILDNFSMPLNPLTHPVKVFFLNFSICKEESENILEIMSV